MTLTVLAWDHPRATRPLMRGAEAWTGPPFRVVTRSLAAFGDEVPAAGPHDLVLIDHPHVGEAAGAGAIRPLDDLLDAGDLEHLAADAVGASHVSYRFAGRQWALAIDAACQARAARPGVVVPTTWPEVVADARREPGSIGLPLHPAHAISALLSLLAAHGHVAGDATLAPPATLAWAVGVLAELAALGPDDAYDWEPPQALAALTHGTIDCVPLVYAYVGYDVAWHDPPSVAPGRAPSSIAGGVGIAVTAGSRHPTAAAALARWLASPDVQRDIVASAGGQPASRAAWDDPSAAPLFRALRRTMERAVLRPRDPWWPAFQRRAGEVLADGLAARRDVAELATALETLYARRQEVNG